MENKILDKITELIEERIFEYETQIDKMTYRVNSDYRISELGIACASGSIRAYKNIISSLKDILKIINCNAKISNTANWKEEVIKHQEKGKSNKEIN